jgi:uncharacterized protein with PIN domain
MRCNGRVRPVAKADVLHLLEPKTRKHYDDFQQCETCDQVYWQGSHFKRLRAVVEGVASETPRSRSSLDR